MCIFIYIFNNGKEKKGIPCHTFKFRSIHKREKNKVYVIAFHANDAISRTMLGYYGQCNPISFNFLVIMSIVETDHQC